MKNIEILRQFPGLASIQQDEFNLIHSAFMYQEVPRKHYLFQTHEPMDAIYLLVSGKVKIYLINDNGKEFILHTYMGKDVFPHIGHYFETDQFPANALVMEKAEIFYIPTERIMDILNASPTMNIFFLKTMGRKSIELQHRLEDKILRTTVEQIFNMIIYLAEKYGVHLMGRNEIRLNETIHNTELGNMVGLTRETVSRVMNQFYEEDILQRDTKGNLIVNTKKFM